MAGTEKQRHSVVCLEEAEGAVRKLRDVLARADVSLPSLRVDPNSYAREAPCPLVDLGRCSVDVARRMAGALEAAAKDAAKGTER